MGKKKNGKAPGILSKALGSLNRFIERKVVRSQRIPSELKREQAQKAYEAEKTKREELVGPLAESLGTEKLVGPLSNLVGFFTSRSLPVHLHKESYDGVPYPMFERKSTFDGQSSFDVWFPTIQFPSFNHDISLTERDSRNPEVHYVLTPEERESSNWIDERLGRAVNAAEDPIKEGERHYRSLLDGAIEAIWEYIVYTEPMFGELDSAEEQRPDQLEHGFELEERGVLYEGPGKEVKIPVFEDESLLTARSRARGLIRAYNRHRPGLEKVIGLLKTSEEIRKEFARRDLHRPGLHDQVAFLEKLGLPLDILPKVTNVREGKVDGIVYSAYSKKGDLYFGLKYQDFLGFIKGIQLPDFSSDRELSPEDRELTSRALKLAFEYALIYNNHFSSSRGSIDGNMPNLVGQESDLAVLSDINLSKVDIPKGFVCPLVEGNPFDGRTFKNLERDIRIVIKDYLPYKEAIDGIARQLKNDATFRRDIRESSKDAGRGLDVSAWDYKTVEVIASRGAPYMTETEFYRNVKKDGEEKTKK